jgi:hypothetical protein
MTDVVQRARLSQDLRLNHPSGLFSDPPPKKQMLAMLNAIDADGVSNPTAILATPVCIL